MIAFPGVLAVLALKLGVLGVNLVRFPVLPAHRAAPDDTRTDSVSLLVPVRDEAGTLPTTLPRLLRQPVEELVVLDDQSGDRSARVAGRLFGRHSHARLMAGRPAPPGWAGKTWACHQLGQAARGDVLIFCDADVVLGEDAVPAALREMRRQHADVFSVFPRELLGSLGEALITPLIDDALLCLLPFPLLSAPVPAAATASGSLLMFTRQAYEALGGFAAVRGEIVEDVALARATRRAGLRLGLALGGRSVQTRTYRGYRGAVSGLGRGLLPVFGGSRGWLLAALTVHTAVYVLPVWLVRRDRRWLLPIALAALERFLVALKTHPATAAWQAPLAPLSALAVVPVAGQALRRRQSWKGRSYPCP